MSWINESSKPKEFKPVVVIVECNSSFDGFKAVTRDIAIAHYNGNDWVVKNNNENNLTVLFWSKIPPLKLLI